MSRSLVSDRGSMTAVLAMVGSAACWGLATVMSRDLLNHMQPTTLLVLQLSASVLFLLALARRNGVGRLGPGYARASSIGFLEPGLTYSVGLVGLAMTTAASASIIGATEPILKPVVAFLLFRERPSLRLVACLVVATIGVLLVSSGSFETQPADLLGDALIMLATLFAACYVVLSARIASQWPAATLAAGQQSVGLAFALVVFAAVTATGLEPEGFSALTLPLVAYAALSGIVQYALAFWLYLIGLRTLSAGAAGLWLTLIPVFGVAGAYFWLHEVPTAPMLIGAGMIAIALLMGRREK